LFEVEEETEGERDNPRGPRPREEKQSWGGRWGNYTTKGLSGGCVKPIGNGLQGKNKTQVKNYNS